MSKSFDRSDLERRLPFAVALGAGAAFLPMLRASSLELVDAQGMLSDPGLQGLDWSRLLSLFTSFPPGEPYGPLRGLVTAVEHGLLGNAALGYRIDSLLLHGFNTGLLYLLLLKLLRLGRRQETKEAKISLPLCAAFGASIFSLHPLRVEPVAWLAGRGFLLSAAFTMIALLAYLEHRTGPEPRPAWRRVSLAAYALALLSQSLVWTFPLILLVVDRHLPARPASAAKGSDSDLRPEWLDLLPFFLLGATGWVFLNHSLYLDPLILHYPRAASGAELARWVWAFSYSLGRTVLPIRLAPWHPQPFELGPLLPGLLLGAAGLISLTAAAVAFRRRWPAGLSLWAAYLLLHVPCLSLARSPGAFQFQSASDSWAYLPSMAVAAGAALLVFEWSRAWKAPLRGWTPRSAWIGIPALMALLTARQGLYWKDAEALWSHNLAVEPECYECHMALARSASRRGSETDAGRHREAAAAILSRIFAPPVYGSQDADVFFNEGFRLGQQGKVDPAIGMTALAVRLDPGMESAHNNLGYFLEAKGRLKEAAEQFQEALRLNPQDQLARNNLSHVEGVIASVNGAPPPAASRDATSLFNEGFRLGQQGKLDEAIEATKAALRLDPRLAGAHNNLGFYLQAKGRLKEAAEQFQEALRLNPQDELARNNLRSVQALLGRK